jgi:hypothetical protein
LPHPLLELQFIMAVVAVVVGILETILVQVEMAAAVLALNTESPMGLLAQPTLEAAAVVVAIQVVAPMILALVGLVLLFLN